LDHQNQHGLLLATEKAFWATITKVWRELI